MATWLVTGANRGIGLSLSKQLAARGDKVIGVCRATSAALDASGATVVDGVDVSDAAAVAALPARIGDVRIDGLVLNAGIFTNESLDALDADGFARIQRQFEVNALGPLRVAAALQAQLAEGAKIGIITSRMGSVADNGSGGSYGYRMSKAALNAAGRSLALDLAPRGISVGLLHPGYVRTDMTGRSGNVEPSEAASMLVARIDELDAATSGTFRHASGEELPW